jgi:hypothetical protein
MGGFLLKAALIIIAIITWPFVGQCKELWAPVDCWCIIKVEGSCLKIQANTPEPVQFGITIGFNEPDLEGYFHPSARPTAYSGGYPLKKFEASFCGLQPNTMYYYVVRIWDVEDGDISHRVGAAWTKMRNLQIFFNQLDMIDDSDNTTAGDFTLHIEESGKSIFQYGWDKGDDWISSGETVYPKRSNYLKNVGYNYLDLYFWGFDDDPGGPDHATKRVKIGVQHQPAFSVRVKAPPPSGPSSSTLDFKAHFTTKEWWVRREDVSTPDLSHLQPKRKAIITKNDRAIDLLLTPPPPIIQRPLAHEGFCGSVLIWVKARANSTVDPIEKIKFQFQWYNSNCRNTSNPDCWTKKAIADWQAKQGVAISGGILRSAFTPQGHWRMRIRSVTKSGRKSDWSDYRRFKVIPDADCH